MTNQIELWYEKLFANYGKNYDKEIFTTGSIGEYNFIEQEVGFKDFEMLVIATRLPD